MLVLQLLLLFWFGLGVQSGQSALSIYESNCQLRPCYTLNLACDNDGQLKQCFKGARLVNPKEFQDEIDSSFNTLRDNAAGGKVYKNLPIAARMGRMSWNTELAHLAKLDVYRCQLQPTPCISTQTSYRAGRLAETYAHHYDNTSSGLGVAIQSIISGWTQHVRSITRYATLHVPDNLDEHNILSTSLLLLEDNTQYACAGLQYVHEYNFIFLFSCLFNTDNQEDQRMYQWGIRPGERCRRRDKRYTNLCAVGENYVRQKNHRKVQAVRLMHTT
ncbi:maker220 [Drosophila busckii]|uniref:Maker220 n=1 Tax=Drosophila busckii TaxID=30019 RepID=A0A0M4EQ78_DROBS|nr:allergen Tab y 5.0101 [Drosophila busckii]ALC47101.1 maker220 [Drosophila busckii]